MSQSSQWSASAGSIYPAMKRLERRELVSCQKEEWGKRERSHFRLTPAGLEALTKWICDLNPSLTTPTPDPVRTRLFFIDAVPRRGDQQAVIKSALALTEARLIDLNRLVRDLDGCGPQAEYLAAIGGVYELEARLSWLRHVSNEIARQPLERATQIPPGQCAEQGELVRPDRGGPPNPIPW